MAYFKVVFGHLHGQTEENHENFSQGSLKTDRFK